MIAICSAFKKGLIAIDINGKEDFIEVDANVGHSEKMLPSIDLLLDKNNLSILDNKSFVIVIGPGSFTGIRIGVAIVKGLCAGLIEMPKIYQITSFDLMAYTYIKHFNPQKDFVCILNALSGKVFRCKFNIKGEAISQAELTMMPSSCSNETYVGLKEEMLCENLIDITAQDLLECAKLKSKQLVPINIENLSPLYLRKSQAEDELEKKQKNLKKIEKKM